MKRILKWIVDYQDSIMFTISCICFASMMAGFILLGATTASDVDKRLGWSTNIVVPYIRSNYWAEEITTEWVTTADWLLGKQLGLRSDGMVVWREKK